MLLHKAFHFLIFLITLALAVDLRVYQDTSCPNYANDPNSIFLWSSIASFASRPSDGQMVQMVSDAWLSMYNDAVDNNIEADKVPFVMSALALQNPAGRWEVYFASSARGTQSLIYQYSKRERYQCNDMWDTVPHDLEVAINQCARNPSDRHVFDAKCGEINALLDLYLRTDDASILSLVNGARSVAWQGNVEDGQYDGEIKNPCWSRSDSEFGCRDVLQVWGNRISVVPKGTAPESYDRNQPVSVDFQPLFPGFE